MQPPQVAAASQQQQQQQSQQQSQQQQQHSQPSAASQSFSSSQNVNMQSSYRQYTDPAPKPQVDDVMPIYSVSSPAFCRLRCIDTRIDLVFCFPGSVLEC